MRINVVDCVVFFTLGDSDYWFVVCQVRSVPVSGMCFNSTVVWVQEPLCETFVHATLSSYRGLMKGEYQASYQFLRRLRSSWETQSEWLSLFMCCPSGGWSNLDWWRVWFDGCRNILWKWSVMSEAGRPDCTLAVTVMTRSAVKQARFQRSPSAISINLKIY